MSISPDNAWGAMSGTLAGAIVTVLVWSCSYFWHVEIPNFVAAAITTIVTVIVYFIVCHLVPVAPGPAVSLEIKP